MAAHGAARASVRTVWLTVRPSPPSPQLGQPPPPTPAPYAEGIGYDDSDGLVVVVEGGRNEPSIQYNGQPAPYPTWPGFGAISLAHCGGTHGPRAPELDLSTNDAPFMQTTDPYYGGTGNDSNGIPPFTLTDSAVGGALMDASSLRADGRMLALSWSDPSNLSYLNLTCVRVDGRSFYFDGYSPAELPPIGGYWLATSVGGDPMLRRHPGEIAFSGDRTALVGRARWRGWGQPVARATAVLDTIDSCTPDCATAPRYRFPVHLTASRPIIDFHRRVYSLLTLRLPRAIRRLPSWRRVPLVMHERLKGRYLTVSGGPA